MYSVRTVFIAYPVLNSVLDRGNDGGLQELECLEVWWVGSSAVLLGLQAWQRIRAYLPGPCNPMQSRAEFSLLFSWRCPPPGVGVHFRVIQNAPVLENLAVKKLSLKKIKTPLTRM